MIFNTKYNFQQIASGILVPILVLVIGLGIYFFLIPQFQQIGSQKALLEQQQRDLEKSVQSLDEVKILLSEFEQSKPDLTVLDDTIPTSPAIPELLANIEYLGNQSGLTVTSINIAPAQTVETSGAGESIAELQRLEDIASASQNLEVMEVTIDLVGRYQNVKSFLINLEKNLRLMDISEMVFGSVDEESGLQEYSVVLQTYYQQ